MPCPKRCPNGTTCNNKNKQIGQCVAKGTNKPAKTITRKKANATATNQIIHEVVEKAKKDVKVAAKDKKIIEKTAEKLEEGNSKDISWIKRQMLQAESIGLFLLRYKYYLLIVAAIAAGVVNKYSGGGLFKWAGDVYYHSTNIPRQIEQQALIAEARQIEERIVENPIVAALASAITKLPQKVFGGVPKFTDKVLQTDYEMLTSNDWKKYDQRQLIQTLTYIKENNIMCNNFDEGAAVINEMMNALMYYIKHPTKNQKRNEWFNNTLKILQKYLSPSCKK